MNVFARHFLYASTIGLGSITAGIIITYYSPAKPSLLRDLSLDESDGTLFNTIALFSAALGAVIAKPLVKFVGRRLSTFINNALSVASYVVLASATSPALAFTMRALQGVTTGVNGAITPMYLVESSPEEYRGTFGVFHQTFTNIGQAYVFCLGIFCQWRMISWLSLVFSALICCLIWFVPESPVNEEDLRISMMFQRIWIPRFLHAFALIAVQQFSGINAVLTNLSQIFEDANSSLQPEIASLIVSLAPIPSCFMCSWLVEKIGRRPTLAISLTGSCFAHLMFWAQDIWQLSTAIPIVALFLYMFAFGIGIGPVVWIVVPELFDDSVRSLFMSVIVMLNWGMAGAVAALWPTIQKGIQLGWGFFIFACVCAIGLVYSIVLMPETRGHEMEEGDKDVNMMDDP